MTAVTGIIQKQADESWAWPHSRIELGPDQAVFFLRKRDCALLRVELSGADTKTVRSEPRCAGLVVSRDFGVRLRLPCEFAGPLRGEIDAEVRLRLLDNAAEWPRRLPQLAVLTPHEAAGSPEQALGRLVAALFESEIAGLAAGRTYVDFSRHLHDPRLLRQAEERLRSALARWTEEGIVSLLALHLFRVASPEADRQQRSIADHHRLEEEHAQKLLRTRQANELAKLEQQRILGAPDEVRWRLFGPADLLPLGARPPPLLKESSAPYEALSSGQHLQLFVRPVKAGHVYVLALGPYRTAKGPEYRWLRLLGNEGRSDLRERPARRGGNRLAGGETLLFPADAGAAELFQHYLTIDAAPGWESLAVAITPQAVPDSSLSADLPRPPDDSGDFQAFQCTLTHGLQSVFGTEARIYLFQFFHS